MYKKEIYMHQAETLETKYLSIETDVKQSNENSIVSLFLLIKKQKYPDSNILEDKK